MRDRIDGAQYAQVDNHDPFASPVWRSPVYRTPEPVIWLVQLVRLTARTTWFLIRHPLLILTAAIIAAIADRWAWPGLAIAATTLAVVLANLRLWRPAWFTALVTRPLRNRWRWLCYRRRWVAVPTIAGLAPPTRAGPWSSSWGKCWPGGALTGSRCGWCLASPPPRSLTAPITWPAGSERCPAGSAVARPGPSCWSCPDCGGPLLDVSDSGQFLTTAILV